MNKATHFLGHTVVNGFLLTILFAILAAPVVFSLIFLSSEETPSSAFKLTPSADNYDGFLSFGKVAGGQVEEVTVNYAAFPDFEAFYDGIFVVENTQKTTQTFVIREASQSRIRLFFGQIGADTGPNETTLKPGEKATINLAAQSIFGPKPTTQTLTFTLQSFPEK